MGRMTITRKFVGLSVVLLAIMLAAAVYAFFQSARLNRETALLVEVIEPLGQEIAAITGMTAEEELANERALRYGGPQVRDGALHEGQNTRFQVLNADVDRRLAALTAHIGRYGGMDLPKDVAVVLGRLQLESESVRREHAAYRAAVEAFLDPAQPPTGDALRAREAAAQGGEKRVLAALERMGTEADALSATDEKRLAALEHRGFAVSV